MGQRVASVVALATILALAGCGGGGGASTAARSSSAERHSAKATTTSTATEPVSSNVHEFAEEWDAAVTSQDCADFKRLVKVPSYVDCSQVGAQGTAEAEAAYGPDGVIDTSAETCDLVDFHQRLKVDQCFVKFPRTIGTSPGRGSSEFDPADFRRALDGSLDGLRTRDCTEFFKYAYTGEGSSAEVCGYVFGPEAEPVIKALEADPRTAPQPLGGNGFWQFYGLAVKGMGYVTVPVACAPHYFKTNPCLAPEPTLAG